jgi:hypothetical protein
MVESQVEERTCVPEYLSYDSLNRILIAYLKSGADKKAVSYRDASIRSGIHYTRVSGNNKFFVYAGFLTEEGKGSFKLTENGSKYAQLLDWGRLDEAKEPLIAILKECSLVNIIVDYITINEKVTRDDFRMKIGSIANISRAKRYVAGINALVDMLIFSGLITEEDGTIRKGEQVEYPVEAKVQEKRAPSAPTFGGLEKPTILAKPKEINVPISLSIDISAVDDVEKLREILRAIREELVEGKKKG